MPTLSLDGQAVEPVATPRASRRSLPWPACHRLPSRCERPCARRCLAALEGVVTRLAVAAVDIGAAVEEVVARTFADDVRARTALELVIAARRTDRHGREEVDVVPEDKVVTTTSEDVVVPGCGDACVADGTVAHKQFERRVVG